MIRLLQARAAFSAVAAILIMGSFGCGNPGGGSYARWQKIELSFEGPSSQGLGAPNPFAVPFDVTFTSADGASFRVPGFYDGDGRGGVDGNVWKVRFSADRNGAWTYRTESAESALNGQSGSFTVVDPPADAPEFYRVGRLEYVNHRFLKFREGGYWLKFGADEPESFLGDVFGRGDWAGKKRQVDYLASKGINAVYIMTHTLDGDGKDVWPWYGATAEEAKRNADRFDTAKLEQWRDFFEYIQSRGIVIQIVLEDDAAWTGYDHERYYREVVARFGYLPAIYFNFCEEYNERYKLDEALGHMKSLAEIDPYNHPRAIHNERVPSDGYVRSPYVNVTSIQTSPQSPESLNQLAIDWMQTCLVQKQRPLVVSFDEGRPADDRRSWWAVYLGGGMWEPYVPVPNGYAAVEPLWEELGAAGEFMESMPFERMFPANHLVKKGKAFCLARPGESYALYLPGGGSLELDLVSGNEYRAEWFDPKPGVTKRWVSTAQLSGGLQSLAAPGEGDWALRITRTKGDNSGPPTAASSRIFSLNNAAVPLRMAVLDGDEKALTYEIAAPPKHGRLAGEGADRVYTPRTGYTGPDRFTWRVTGATGASNAAVVDVFANASGVNNPPKVEDQAVTTAAGTPVTFILRYTDPDGPGPYRINVSRLPSQGRLEGTDNDVTYTPSPGFKGTDAFRWRVDDGRRQSAAATVTITVK